MLIRAQLPPGTEVEAFCKHCRVRVTFIVPAPR
jgi:hypothetical protein